MTVALLDTCTLLWTAEGALAPTPAMTVMSRAATAGLLYVSPITAWELGMLVSKRRLDLAMPVEDWFAGVVRDFGAVVAPLTPAILIESSFLPGTFHKDPSDRIVVATARHLKATLITRDRKILAYADAGHVDAVAC